MQKKIRIPGKISNKIFIANNKKNLDNALTIFDGRDVELIIGIPDKIRTLPQNKYLWDVPYSMIAGFCGVSKESVHNEMGQLFRKVSVGIIPEIISTTKLSTKQFSTYIDDIIKWAAEELSLYIPYPNENEMWGD